MLGEQELEEQLDACLEAVELDYLLTRYPHPLCVCCPSYSLAAELHSHSTGYWQSYNGISQSQPCCLHQSPNMSGFCHLCEAVDGYGLHGSSEAHQILWSFACTILLLVAVLTVV